MFDWCVSNNFMNSGSGRLCSSQRMLGVSNHLRAVIFPGRVRQKTRFLECLLALECSSCPSLVPWNLTGDCNAAVLHCGFTGLLLLILNKLGDLPVISVFLLLHSLLVQFFFFFLVLNVFFFSAFSSFSPLTVRSHFPRRGDPCASPALLSFGPQIIWCSTVALFIGWRHIMFSEFGECQYLELKHKKKPCVHCKPVNLIDFFIKNNNNNLSFTFILCWIYFCVISFVSSFPSGISLSFFFFSVQRPALA